MLADTTFSRASPLPQVAGHLGSQVRSIRILMMVRVNFAVALLCLPAGTSILRVRGASGPLLNTTLQMASVVPKLLTWMEAMSLSVSNAL